MAARISIKYNSKLLDTQTSKRNLNLDLKCKEKAAMEQTPTRPRCDTYQRL